MRQLRGLSAHKSYGLLAVVTLTLAVGANLLVFTIVNALWLRPRPVANPDRVVVISNTPALGAVGDDSPIDLIRAPVLEDARRLAVFEGVAGQVATGGGMGDFRPRVVINRVGHPVETLGVTSQYFSVLGVGIKGRDFTADDDRPGAPGVAIISDRLWKSAFGGQQDVIGTRVETSHVPLQIVGVAPARFLGARLGEQTDLWVPRYLVPQVSNSAGVTGSQGTGTAADWDFIMPLFGIGRLRPGVTAADAERAMAQPLARLIVRPLKDVFGAPNRWTIVMREQGVIWILAVTASLVLLAGCTTLMAIVLVHYERRRQELAVRLALGATRARLVSQLGIELLALGAAGLAGAFAVTAWAVRILPALSLPGGVDLGRLDLSIDWRVATVGILAAVGALSAAAAVPILRFSRANLVMGLVSPTTTGAPSSLRLRRIMLGLHVAATIIVLVAAGLFVRTVAYGFGRGPGFDVDHTAFLQLQPSFTEFFDPREAPDEKGMEARKLAAFTRLLERLRELPGIETVAIGDSPLRPDLPSYSKTRTVTADAVTHEMAVVTSSYPPGYLEALGARMIAGRPLEAADVVTAGVRPAVVTATFVENLWPNSVAVGRQFSMASRNQGQTYSIVGIVPDMVCYSLRSEPCATVFVASNEHSASAQSQVMFGITLTIRTRGDAALLVEPVRRLASQTFPKASRLDVRTGRDLVALDLGQERLGLWFFSGFGLVVLALGLGGVFGLVAYLAESKRRELGLRMALGATHATLLRRIVLTGLWPVVSGTAAGLIAAVFLAKTLDTLLVGITHLDLTSYAGAAAIMIGGAIAGGLAAAWRIRRLSPLAALRAE